MVFVNFHRMFTFLSVAFHVLIVHAFVGFGQPLLFASAAMTAAACATVLETHALFIHGQALMCSRRASYRARSRHASPARRRQGGHTPLRRQRLLPAAACAPYLQRNAAGDLGVLPAGRAKDPDGDLVGKRSGGDLAVDDPKDKRAYRLFWVAILLVKFAMDYVFIVHSLADALAGHHADRPVLLELQLRGRGLRPVRLRGRYPVGGDSGHASVPPVRVQAADAVRALVTQPDAVLLQHVLLLPGVSRDRQRVPMLRWRGVSDGWSKVVRNLPTRIEAFERRMLTKDARPLVDRPRARGAVRGGAVAGRLRQGVERSSRSKATAT